MLTLPDYLREGLDIIFVGINPGLYSAKMGHYFATPRNRFWAAFNAAGMTPKPLGPETDRRALEYGIGFTDVVKRATRQMAELKTAEFREGAKLLREKLLRRQPLVICFNGLSGYKNYLRHTEPCAPVRHTEHRSAGDMPSLGLQSRRIGRSRVYVIPSTSPANAAVSLERIVREMRALKALVQRIKEGHGDD